jgi:hypothetical protein
MTLPSSTRHCSNKLMPQITPWGKHSVLVQGDNLAQRRRAQLRRQNHRAGPVARHHLVATSSPVDMPKEAGRDDRRCSGMLGGVSEMKRRMLAGELASERKRCAI